MSRTIVTTAAIVTLIVAAAVVLTPNSEGMSTITDAIAIVIVVTVLSLQVWMRQNVFRSPSGRGNLTLQKYRSPPAHSRRAGYSG